MPEPVPFTDLPALAQHLRDELENKKFILHEFIERYPFNLESCKEADTKEEAI